MWYPTRDELIAAHVITRVSLGGEAAISRLGMRSKQELLLIWESIPLFQAIEKRFPGTTDKAVERGWAMKEDGGTDAEIANAVRSIVSEIYPKLLKTADVSTLDSFVKLMISEMSAAQAISGEACTMLLDGKLNIVQTLPREIAEQEKQLLLRALASPPTTALTPPDPAQFTQALQNVWVNLPQKYIKVVDDMKAYANQSALACEAMIALYRAIAALPPRERHVALRGMFQSEDGEEKIPRRVPLPESEPLAVKEEERVRRAGDSIGFPLETGDELVPAIFPAGGGRLTVVNETASDAVVKLVEEGRGTTLLRYWFVGSRKKVALDDLGPCDCSLYIGLGKEWDHNTRKFRLNRSYGKYKEPLTFTETKTPDGTSSKSYIVSLEGGTGALARTLVFIFHSGPWDETTATRWDPDLRKTGAYRGASETVSEFTTRISCNRFLFSCRTSNSLFIASSTSVEVSSSRP